METTKNVDAYLLNIDNIEKNIGLGGKGGLLAIRKVHGTNEVILEEEVDTKNLNEFVISAWPLLSFIFNRGIKPKKRLTYYGRYNPDDSKQNFSPLSGVNYNADEFGKYLHKINSLCKSSDIHKNKKGRKIYNMLKIYQNSLLMIPEFWSESYNNLIRILDCQYKSEETSALYFPHKAMRILSHSLMNKIFNEIKDREVYKIDHLPYIKRLFKKLTKQNKKKSVLTKYSQSDASMLFYTALYSAYEHRNKFIHDGLEFPNKIKNIETAKERSWMNYFYVTFPSDDEYRIVNKKLEKRRKPNYKKLYLLLPKWHLLNIITREVIKYHLKKLEHVKI